MKQRLLYNTLLAIAGAVWIAAAPVQAAGPVANNPPYQESGKVNAVNLGLDQIIIDNRVYVFANNVTIQSGKRIVSKGALTKGMSLGFNSTPGQHRSVVTEIWILPALPPR